jgi:hypothetical protein
MEMANVRLRLNKVGSDVPILGVTPFEAVLLHVLHQANNGGSTFGDEMNKIEVAKEPAKTGDKPRTDIEEYKRLQSKYGSVVNKKGDKIVALVWAGLGQKPPQTFKELIWKDVQFDGTEVAPLNYATGGVATTAPVAK